MTADPNKDLYEKTMALLKPVLERVASDAAFRERLESSPLEVMDELGVELDSDMRSELEGKRFSEFWAARRRSVEGPMEIRDLPPNQGALEDRQLDAVSGGAGLSTNLAPILNFAPPYVPLMPSFDRNKL